MIIHKRSSFLILGQNAFLFFSSPDVGYVQGMNDVLSRFLIVLGSEAQAYWCFTNYMETVKRDFLDDGMLDKISKFVILSHCCLCPCMLDLIFFFVFWFSCLVLFLYIFWLNIARKMLKKENLELQCMTATQTRIKNVQQNDFCKKMFFILLFLALLYVFFLLMFF